MRLLKFFITLAELDKIYGLHIYSDDGHGLRNNWKDVNTKTVEWFNKYL